MQYNLRDERFSTLFLKTTTLRFRRLLRRTLKWLDTLENFTTLVMEETTQKLYKCCNPSIKIVLQAVQTDTVSAVNTTQNALAGNMIRIEKTYQKIYWCNSTTAYKIH